MKTCKRFVAVLAATLALGGVAATAGETAADAPQQAAPLPQTGEKERPTAAPQALADQDPADAFGQQLCSLMAEIKEADAKQRKATGEGLDLDIIHSGLPGEIHSQIAAMAKTDPENLAQAMEKLFLTNKDFQNGNCASLFARAAVRDHPGVIGRRFGALLANPQLSDAVAVDLLLAALPYRYIENAFSMIPETVILRRANGALRLDDPERVEVFKRLVCMDDCDGDDCDGGAENGARSDAAGDGWHEKIETEQLRFCDKAYILVRHLYPESGLVVEDFWHAHSAFPARAPLIARAKEFVAQKLARLDAAKKD